MAHDTRQRLIKALDRVFSKYIRLRDSIVGYSVCITCGKRIPWKELDCGHYIGRRYFATRWDEKNCAAQCKRCNNWGEGEKPIFREKLVEKYGEAEIVRMETRAKMGAGITIDWLIWTLEEYRIKLGRQEGIL